MKAKRCHHKPTFPPPTFKKILPSNVSWIRLLVVIHFPESVFEALARDLLIILIKAASVFPGEGVLNRLVGQGCGNSADKRARWLSHHCSEGGKKIHFLYVPLPICTTMCMVVMRRVCPLICTHSSGNRSSFQPVGSSCRRELWKNVLGTGSRNSNLKLKAVFWALLLDQDLFSPFHSSDFTIHFSSPGGNSEKHDCSERTLIFFKLSMHFALH